MLAQNCGLDPGVVLAKVEESNDDDFGFDAVNLEFGSMSKRGIIDPAKVIRTAIQNATSIAISILTTEALITDLPDKKDDSASAGAGAAGMGGMGMGGMPGMM
jgi:chaperonin GroEL